LCGNPTSKSAGGDIALTDFAGLENLLKGWGLPEYVKEFARTIRFTSANRLQLLNFAYQPSGGAVEEFLVTGFNIEGSIGIGYVKARATCTPIPQKKPMTVDQIGKIKEGLLAQAFR
jgi:hypothetical protein